MQFTYTCLETELSTSMMPVIFFSINGKQFNHEMLLDQDFLTFQ